MIVIATLSLVTGSCLITRYLASYLYYMEQYYAIYIIYGEMTLAVNALVSQSRGPIFKTTGWLPGRLSLSSF